MRRPRACSSAAGSARASAVMKSTAPGVRGRPGRNWRTVAASFHDGARGGDEEALAAARRRGRPGRSPSWSGPRGRRSRRVWLFAAGLSSDSATARATSSTKTGWRRCLPAWTDERDEGEEAGHAEEAVEGVVLRAVDPGGAEDGVGQPLSRTAVSARALARNQWRSASGSAPAPLR